MGELKSPLLITALKGDSIIFTKVGRCFNGCKWITIPPGNYSSIKIDPEHKMTELFRLNNNIRTSGIFRKADPANIQFLYTIENTDKRYLLYFPLFQLEQLRRVYGGNCFE